MLACSSHHPPPPSAAAAARLHNLLAVHRHERRVAPQRQHRRQQRAPGAAHESRHPLLLGSCGLGRRGLCDEQQWKAGHGRSRAAAAQRGKHDHAANACGSAAAQQPARQSSGAPAPGTGAAMRAAEFGELIIIGAWLRVARKGRGQAERSGHGGCGRRQPAQQHVQRMASQPPDCQHLASTKTPRLLAPTHPTHPPHVGHQHQKGAHGSLHAGAVRVHVSKRRAGAATRRSRRLCHHGIAAAGGRGRGCHGGRGRRQVPQQLQAAGKLLEEGAHAAGGLRAGVGWAGGRWVGC